MDGDPRYISTDEAARILGLRPVTLAKMRRRGDGPPYRCHGRLVRYAIPDLREWSDARVTVPARRPSAPRTRKASPARKDSAAPAPRRRAR